MTQTALITGKLLLGALYTSIAVAIVATAMLAVSPKALLAPTQRVILGNQELMVWVADTSILKEKGLSNLKALKENEGMLFIFEKPDKYGFWMKEMLFPIDIIWFDSNRKIVEVWENAIPESYPKIVKPKEEVLYVLEVNAGFFKNHALKIGDIIELGLQ